MYELKFRVGDVVYHPTYGTGKVLGYSAKRMRYDVQFGQGVFHYVPERELDTRA